VLLTAGVIAVATVDGVLFDWARFREIPYPTKPVAAKIEPFYQLQSHWTTMLDDVLKGHGAISCLEEAPLQRAEQVELGPVPQAKLADPAAGSIDGFRWTPNRLSVDASMQRASTVLFNQNWNEHWKATAGEVVKYGNKWSADPDGGLLGVALPPGEHSLQVYYRPRSVPIGTTVTAFSGVLALIVLWRSRRQGHRASPS
jgi:hypothetical protein